MFNFSYKILPGICCMFLSSACLLTGCSTSPKDASASDISVSQTSEFAYSVNIGFRTYYGTFTGETQSGMPQGQGTFAAVDDETSEPLFTYTGDFQNGEFSGKGQIEYTDGSLLTGSFRSNAANGACTFVNPDHTWRSVKYYDGNPYGLVKNYSDNDELLSYDWYYNKELISDLKELSEQIDYKELYHQTDSYKNNIIQLTCRVKSVMETETKCYLTLEDSDRNIYLASYNNTTLSRYKQAIIPTLQSGDSIVIYGFYAGLDSISHAASSNNKTSAGYLYPRLEPFYAETTDRPAFQLNEGTFSYDEIAANPYMCSQQSIRLSGTVLGIYEGSKRYFIKFCETSEKSALTDHIYFMSIFKNNCKTVPAPGDPITVKGMLNGNYKLWLSKDSIVENGTSDYELYPLIKASKFTIDQ